MAEYVYTEHALFEMERRGLTKGLVERVLAWPGQQIAEQLGRTVLQSKILMGDPAKVYLVRVVLDVNREPAEIVTAYRTSKISKYWRFQG